MDRFLTLTYRGRTFLIRPVATEDGAWTEAVSEETGSTSDLWKGSGIDYVDPVACMVQAVRDVITVVDEEEAEP
jgi:hypothetical protein